MPAPGGSRGTRTTNSASEVLRALLQDLAIVKTYPDADLEFVSTLEALIVNKLREPVEQLLLSQGVQPPQPSPMGTFPAPPGGGVPGIRSEAPMPPIDELRRLIGGVQG